MTELHLSGCSPQRLEPVSLEIWWWWQHEELNWDADMMVLREVWHLPTVSSIGYGTSINVDSLLPSSPSCDTVFIELADE